MSQSPRGQAGDCQASAEESLIDSQLAMDENLRVHCPTKLHWRTSKTGLRESLGRDEAARQATADETNPHPVRPRRNEMGNAGGVVAERPMVGISSQVVETHREENRQGHPQLLMEPRRPLGDMEGAAAHPIRTLEIEPSRDVGRDIYGLKITIVLRCVRRRLVVNFFLSLYIFANFSYVWC